MVTKVARTTLLVMALAALTLARHPVRADAGARSDPDDSPGRLDISRIGHTNDGENVIYRLETYDGFVVDDVKLITWDFDFNNDGKAADACILIERIVTEPILRGGFYSECGPELWSTADARQEGNVLEITIPVLDLVEGGGLRPGDAYGYRVVTRDIDGVEDPAPDEALVEHTGTPEVTARPDAGDTILGYPGEDTRAPGRSQGGGQTAPAAEEQPAGSSSATTDSASTDDVGRGFAGTATASTPEADETGALDRIPVIGSFCSGTLCFVMGLLSPLLAAVVGLAVVVRVRRRRRLGAPVQDDPGSALTTGDTSPPTSTTGSRSYLGNV